MIEYNPNEIRLDTHEQNLVHSNLTELTNTLNNPSDTLRFAVISDTHRWYDETNDAVDCINRLEDLDFVIHSGDLTEFGLPQEYKWTKDILDGLHVPYFPVIGNHDLVGNGGETFKKMYGAFDYSFVYKNIKFIFLNTNSLEFGFDAPVPDISWLEKQLIETDEHQKIFLTMHVPPMSDAFNPELRNDLKNLIDNDKDIIGVLHGHDHSSKVTNNFFNNLALTGIDCIESRTFLLNTIIDNHISYEEISF